MREYILKLLETEEGREQLSDALKRIIQISNSKPVKETIDIGLIAYNAGHRVVGGKIDTERPVLLIHVALNGFDLYLVHDGNHRIEQSRQFSSRINAVVSQCTFKEYFISADGTSFTRKDNDLPWVVDPIPEHLSKVLDALNLKPINDNRTFIG